MSTSTKINLNQILEEIFLVLTSKEKEVIVKRFSLDSKPRQTLEKIGQHFSVTRERIRQIEKIALGKLRRTVRNTRLNIINDFSNEILKENGGVMVELKLVAEILNRITSAQDLDKYIIRLALNINADVEKIEKNNLLHPYWKFKEIDEKDIDKILATGVKLLKKVKDVQDGQKLAAAIKQELKGKVETTDITIISSLEADKRIKRMQDGFGLMEWRHINPRSIRDKAYIVLKRAAKPLHFVEIANKITEAGFDKKVVTTQAVHNELIRYDQFVLVGRGLYALKEWGYCDGTVSDVIEGLLRKKSPMTKQEIIEGVLKQRQVKKGTISLNLQKNPQFVRVGRAVYKLSK
ncbi:MAG: sigma factor-like helix-turn-helix DNA-binding protein [Candidatus Gracilibacteria bacterium]